MKKKFLLVMEQHNEGCDYTIGCGTKVSFVYAESKEKAIEEYTLQPNAWREYIDKHGSLGDILIDTYSRYVREDSEVKCDEITLYEISDEIDLIPLIQKSVDEIRNYAREVKAKKQEEAEFEQFQKLKKKFEK